MLNNQRVTFINMKNFPLLDENGKEWWISRSIAVTGCVFTFLNGKWCVLANKRGEGTPDFQGMWNMPCGYLDFNETTAEAVIREVYEETGVRLTSYTSGNSMTLLPKIGRMYPLDIML